VVYQDDRMVDIIGDQAGQLEENEEYQMGMKESGLIFNFELQGGSPRMCHLRPTSVGSE
jgi:hypothetical protein